MRRYCVIVTLLCLATGTIQAQNELTESFRALTFDGGLLSMNTRLGSNLYGSGLSGGSFSRVHSALMRVDGAVVFGNPASLAHVKRGQIGFEARLPIRNGSLGLGPSSLLRASSIEKKTDRLLSNMSFPRDRVARYTQAVDAVVGQPRQLSAFWLAWPINENVGMGFGYRQPLLLSGTIALSGAKMLLSGRKEGDSQSIQVDILAELALNSSLNIQMDELSIGSGGLLERYYFGSVWWGATVYRSSISAGINLDVLPQGVLTISGTDQFYFNDPGDENLNPENGESNSFFWKIRSGFKGSGLGVRLGLVHRSYTERFGTSLLLNIAPRINMWDNDAYAVSFLPVFVNLKGFIDNDARDSEDLLDIEVLDVTRPNLTRQTHDAIGKWLNIQMPISLTLGIDMPIGSNNLVVNIVRYWGSLSVEGEYGLESGVIQRYAIGKEPSWGLRAGLDIARDANKRGTGTWGIPLRILTLDIDGMLLELMGDRIAYSNPRYRLSGGVQWGRSIVRGIDNTIASDLESVLGGITPTSLSIGRAYTLFDRLDVGVHVIGFPDLLMRFSFGLSFD